MKGKNIQREKRKLIFRIATLLLLPLITIISLIPNVMAHCPLCTAATIVGVGVTRSLGWDDSIVGVFVGAMIVSSALWINNILKKRNIGGSSYLRVGSITTATFVLTILSFYFAGLFGPANIYRIFGMEKIIFGTLSGGIISIVSFYYSNHLKNKNGGKVLFNYQTMLITLATLIINAGLFALIL